MLHPLARPLTAFSAIALALLPAPVLAETAAGNDESTGATPFTVEQVLLEQETSGATVGGEDPQSCFSGYTVWYRLTAPTSGTLRITATASVVVPEGQFDISTGVAAFTGSPGALAEQACALTGPRGSASVDVAVTAGSTLWVVAGSAQTQSDGTWMQIDAQLLASPQVTVDRIGTVTRGGSATLRGALQCAADATVTLIVGLTQDSGGATSGQDVASATCTAAGPAPWTVTVDSTTGRLHPGRAAYTVSVGDGDSPQTTRTGAVLLLPAQKAGRVSARPATTG